MLAREKRIATRPPNDNSPDVETAGLLWLPLHSPTVEPYGLITTIQNGQRSDCHAGYDAGKPIKK
ncbi:MAG: hypothetical protein JWP84_1260 [Tardiphaga sp.]|nr:hypothetical protein [Tardiphaga sp.]